MPVTDITYTDPGGRWQLKRGPEDVFVVPYNPTLLLRHGPCHLNVEVCTGPGAAIYIRKYVETS